VHDSAGIVLKRPEHVTLQRGKTNFSRHICGLQRKLLAMQSAQAAKWSLPTKTAGLGFHPNRASAVAIVNKTLVLALCVGSLFGGYVRADAKGRPATPARTDRYGDPLPEGVSMRFGTVRWQGRARQFVSTPDGQRFLLCNGFEISTIDANTGRRLARVELHRPATGLEHLEFDFSRDRKTIATIESGPKKVRFWDVASGKMLREFDANAEAAVSFTSSPDGSVIVAADYRHRFYVWHAATGERHPLHGADFGQEDHSLWAVFSPDSKFLAVAVEDRFIRVWELRSCRMVRELNVHPACMGYTRNGKHFTCLVDKTHAIKFWDAATWKEEPSFHATVDEPIDFLDDSPDGTLLAVRGEKRIYLWSRTDGKLLHTLTPSAIAWYGFTRDGRRLASFNGRVLSMWDVATGQELTHREGHEAEVEHVAFSPTGKLLASTDRAIGIWTYKKTLTLWDATNARPVRTMRLPDLCGRPVFSADGQLLVAGDSARGIRRWDVPSGKELPALTDRNWEVGFHATLDYRVSPDRKWLAALKHRHDERGRGWCQYWLWDPRSGRVVASRTVADCEFGGSLSADCELVAMPMFKPRRNESGYDWFLRIEEVLTGRERFITNPSGHITRLGFSWDGKSLAAQRHKQATSANSAAEGDIRPEICIWEVATGKERLRFATEGHFSFAWSANARLFATADFKALYLWDGITGKRLSRIHLPEERFLSDWAFSGDSRTLATGADDTTVLTWDVSAELARAGLARRDLDSKHLQRLWGDLAGSDAAEAYRAIWTLAAAPREAVPFLKSHLRSVTEQDLAPIEQWIAELDSPQFRVRASADKALRRWRFEADWSLLEALRNKPSLEGRQRLDAILATPFPDQPSESLAHLRAVEALEHIGNQDAVQVLETLAKGVPRAQLTQEAKASLQRLRGFAQSD
jgi:WD40 repeat protein